MATFHPSLRLPNRNVPPTALESTQHLAGTEAEMSTKHMEQHLPAPSKGCQMVPFQGFNSPVGFNWHPFEGAGIFGDSRCASWWLNQPI